MEGKSIELAACLLDSGAEVEDVLEPEKASLLMVAARDGCQEMVELLLDHGADIKLVDREGRDAIAIAESSGQQEGIVELLQKRRDVQ